MGTRSSTTRSASVASLLGRRVRIVRASSSKRLYASRMEVRARVGQAGWASDRVADADQRAIGVRLDDGGLVYYLASERVGAGCRVAAVAGVRGRAGHAVRSVLHRACGFSRKGHGLVAAPGERL